MEEILFCSRQILQAYAGNKPKNLTQNKMKFAHCSRLMKILTGSKIKGVYIPTIVIGELFYGANKSTNTSKRFEEIEQLVQGSTILEVKKSTAFLYGEIKNQLKLKGKPIPENDIWIAAIAKEYHLTILTKDKHFEEIDGILLEKI